MRSHLLVAAFLVCSFFATSHAPSGSGYVWQHRSRSPENIIDFSLHRMSGSRVYIKWRTEGEPSQVRFEVMRKHKKSTPFVSLGIVEPKEKGSDSAVLEYSFIDRNEYSDSTFYCLRKIDEEGVIFYSLAKAVEGVGKGR